MVSRYDSFEGGRPFKILVLEDLDMIGQKGCSSFLPPICIESVGKISLFLWAECPCFYNGSAVPLTLVVKKREQGRGGGW